MFLPNLIAARILELHDPSPEAVDLCDENVVVMCRLLALFLLQVQNQFLETEEHTRQKYWALVRRISRKNI